MFVKSIICGKAILFKKIDIKGRGKMGLIYVPKCTIKLVLEERHPQEYYKMLLKGECPTGFADLMKSMLKQSDADFDRVKRLSYLTTSAGRHYRKTQFSRLIQQIKKDYQQ